MWCVIYLCTWYAMRYILICHLNSLIMSAKNFTSKFCWLYSLCMLNWYFQCTCIRCFKAMKGNICFKCSRSYKWAGHRQQVGVAYRTCFLVGGASGWLTAQPVVSRHPFRSPNLRSVTKSLQNTKQGTYKSMFYWWSAIPINITIIVVLVVVVDIIIY
jgi:hypothetical protein